MLVEYNGLRYIDSNNRVHFIDEHDVITNFCVPQDFIQIPYTKVFTSREGLNHWLESIKSLENYNQFFALHTGIKVTMGNSLVPYMFQDEDGVIYIVQNAFAGLVEKAIAIGYHWYRARVNVGLNPPEVPMVPPYLLYGITPSEKIGIIADFTGDSPDYLHLLYYGTHKDYEKGRSGKYAAMLEIS